MKKKEKDKKKGKIHIKYIYNKNTKIIEEQHGSNNLHVFSESFFLQVKTTNLQSHNNALLHISLKLTSAVIPTNHSKMISQLAFCDFYTLHSPETSCSNAGPSQLFTPCAASCPASTCIWLGLCRDRAHGHQVQPPDTYMLSECLSRLHIVL